MWLCLLDRLHCMSAGYNIWVMHKPATEFSRPVCSALNCIHYCIFTLNCEGDFKQRRTRNTPNISTWKYHTETQVSLIHLSQRAPWTWCRYCPMLSEVTSPATNYGTLEDTRETNFRLRKSKKPQSPIEVVVMWRLRSDKVWWHTLKDTRETHLRLRSKNPRPT